MLSSRRKAAPLCGIAVAVFSLAVLILCDCLLLGQFDGAILAYNLLFSLLAGLCGGALLAVYPFVFAGFAGGLFIGLILLAFSFEQDTLGSYGLVRLFLSLAIGLAVGTAMEIPMRLVKARRERERREAALAKLLFRR